MKQSLKKVSLESKRQFELVDITKEVQAAVKDSGVSQGIAVVFSNHTTASIRLNHNEPLLIQDVMKMIYRLVPVETGYSHDLFEIRKAKDPNERSNGHAHVKAFLLGSSETVMVEKGQLLLGEKQSLFFVEFDGGRKRDFYIKILGE
jgi:secondary thiamine-phosphate synthase enzyme